MLSLNDKTQNAKVQMFKRIMSVQLLLPYVEVGGGFNSIYPDSNQRLFQSIWKYCLLQLPNFYIISAKLDIELCLPGNFHP